MSYLLSAFVCRSAAEFLSSFSISSSLFNGCERGDSTGSEADFPRSFGCGGSGLFLGKNAHQERHPHLVTKAALPELV
jgi:hypothetical protein